MRFSQIQAVLPVAFALFHSISAVDICDWHGGAELILYHEYRDPPCVVPNHLLPSGDCEPRVVQELVTPSCLSFCQIRANFIYGREVPLMNAYCHGPMKCTVKEAIKVGMSWKLKVPSTVALLGLVKGVRHRKWKAPQRYRQRQITGGFAGDTDGVTNSQSRQIDMAQGECGYFTFIPIDKDVW
jgi:hypothetical protein